jgi:pyruvate/2-oxoglutarate/acetoin dehydrogenase E1 component
MPRKISFKQAINEALDLEMRRDPTVILLGEDIVGGAGSPERPTPGAACSASPRVFMPSTAIG